MSRQTIHILTFPILNSRVVPQTCIQINSMGAKSNSTISNWIIPKIKINIYIDQQQKHPKTHHKNWRKLNMPTLLIDPSHNSWCQEINLPQVFLKEPPQTTIPKASYYSKKNNRICVNVLRWQRNLSKTWRAITNLKISCWIPVVKANQLAHPEAGFHQKIRQILVLTKINTRHLKCHQITKRCLHSLQV